MNQRTSSPPRNDHHSAASQRRSQPAHHALKERHPARPGTSGPDPAAAPHTAALDLHTVRIGYFRPDAHEVFVAGSFNEWDRRGTPLKRDSFGDWSVELLLPPGEHRYRLVVDGEWRDDPSAQRMDINPFGGFDAVIEV
jgi:hypothetical protein